MSGDKKGSAPAANFEKCSVVLVDVLGTTTSINFAKETLFPFVTKNAEEVLKVKWEEEDVKSAVKKLKEGDEAIDLETTAKLVKELTESESDNPGLKALQGIISKKGYENGDLKAHVFSDVPASFESWAKSRKVAIYSSGSADSQKHIFAKSTEGDLSHHISNYFDQSVGPKTESGSYKKIAEELAVKPEEVLFISDLIEEVKAAKIAGLAVAVITREGNAKLPEDSKDYPVISSFKEITFENLSKRKNVDEPAVTEEPPSKVAKIESESKNVSEKPKVKNSEMLEDKAMDVDTVAAEQIEKPQEDVTSDTPVENPTTTEIIEKTETVEKTESTPVEDVTMKDADSIDEKTSKIEVSKSGDMTEEVVDSTEKTEIAEKNAQENTQNQAEAVEKIEDEKKVSEKAEEIKKEESNEVNGDVLADADVSEKPKLTEKQVEEQVYSPSKDGKQSVETESKTEDTDKKTETTVESSEVNSSSEEKNEPGEKPNDNKQVADSSVVVNVTDDVQTTVDSKESSKPVDDTLSEEKVDSTESTTLESNSVKVDEEKENKKDLANVLENGDTKTTTNGDTTEEIKVNGDSKTDGEAKEETKEKSKGSAGAEENVDEIKAKKAEATAAATEAPAVSVEV